MTVGVASVTIGTAELQIPITFLCLSGLQMKQSQSFILCLNALPSTESAGHVAGCNSTWTRAKYMGWLMECKATLYRPAVSIPYRGPVA